ncbi:MAG: helix-hairpin-helix domain-containing protein [Candidatus Acidiferrales bacterium]
MPLLIFALCGVATAQKKHPAKPIDLNGATAQQLELVPGIGPATAQSIVRFREKSGPFQRVEDLLAIRGISRTKLEKMRPYLTITQPVRKSPQN